MDIVMQLMMGISLAACAGLRACAPLLLTGILARGHYVPLNPAFAFLTHTDTLIILSVATALEFFGDKIVVVDHLLDAVGTFVRPVAGTILTSSLLSHTHPDMAVLLGLATGGSSALTVHAGKAATRVKLSALAPLHLGIGNMGASLIEEVVVLVGILLAFVSPVLGFCFALLLISLALFAVWLCYKAGVHLMALLRNRRSAQTPVRAGD